MVYYDFQERPPGSATFDGKAKLELPPWLLERLSEDFFADVVFAQLGGISVSDRKDKIPMTSPECAVRHLSGLRKLRYLFFVDEEITDEGLRCIGTLENLECLRAVGGATTVTDAGVANVSRLRNLKTLVLFNSQITDKAFQTFGGLHSLERLLLGGSRISDHGLVHIRGLTNLRSLDLGGGSRITDEGMASLSGLLRLQYLVLSGANVTSAGVEHLKHLTQMRYLDLSNNREIGDDAMRVIASFDLLEELRLRGTKISSRGMIHLAGLNKLRVLDLSCNGRVTDEGIAYLADLTTLEELNLSNTSVSSAAVASLDRLTILQRIDLSDNLLIDERAIPYLARHVTLNELDLHHTKSRMTQENAGTLAPLTALTHLNLAETGSNCRAVMAILPGCQVAGALANSRAELGPSVSDYSELVHELGVQLTNGADFALAEPDTESEAGSVFPPPRLMPAYATLERMVALTKTIGVDQRLAEQRPVLEASADAFSALSPEADSRFLNEAARKLWALAKSDPSLGRLYSAAIYFSFADRFSEHQEYLDGVRDAFGLTDDERGEYENATMYAKFCLREAAQQLGLDTDPSANDSESLIIRIWKDSYRLTSFPRGGD